MRTEDLQDEYKIKTIAPRTIKITRDYSLSEKEYREQTRTNIKYFLLDNHEIEAIKDIALTNCRRGLTAIEVCKFYKEHDMEIWECINSQAEALKLTPLNYISTLPNANKVHCLSGLKKCIVLFTIACVASEIVKTFNRNQPRTSSHE